MIFLKVQKGVVGCSPNCGKEQDWGGWGQYRGWNKLNQSRVLGGQSVRRKVFAGCFSSPSCGRCTERSRGHLFQHLWVDSSTASIPLGLCCHICCLSGGPSAQGRCHQKVMEDKRRSVNALAPPFYKGWSSQGDVYEKARHRLALLRRAAHFPARVGW